LDLAVDRKDLMIEKGVTGGDSFINDAIVLS